MKAKIILYGWVLSLIPMIAGLVTMAWAVETGDPIILEGMALFFIWVLFCWLVIRNEKIVDEEAKRFEDWFDRVFGNNN